MLVLSDPSQTYALYVPSHCTPERSWPVILAFDPRACRRVPVEIYQAAAERFGYTVAGSNNSRNGSWAMSMAATEAMTNDVIHRFQADRKRIYTAGMSGGSRVALGIAISSNLIAGVIASSAGYPDSKPRVRPCHSLCSALPVRKTSTTWKCGNRIGH